MGNTQQPGTSFAPAINIPAPAAAAAGTAFPAQTVIKNSTLESSTSAAGTMAGYGFFFTPTGTGKVNVRITGSVRNVTAGSGSAFLGAYGTGGPPANGAASTGTQFGNVNTVGVTSSTAGAFGNFIVEDTVTGLTVGTRYWFDLVVSTLTGGTVNVLGATAEFMEVS